MLSIFRNRKLKNINKQNIENEKKNSSINNEIENSTISFKEISEQTNTRIVKGWITDWFKINDDYCEKGDAICKITFNGMDEYGIEVNSYISIQENSDGVIEIIKEIGDENNNLLIDNEVIYRLKHVNKNVLDAKLNNKPIIEFDDFKKKKILKWLKVGGNSFYDSYINGFITTISEDQSLSILFFTFQNIDGLDYLIFSHSNKDFMLEKNDKIEFLFDNNEIVEYVLSDKSIFVKNTYDDSLKKLYENKTLLTNDELGHFKNYNLLKWKISLTTGREIFGMRTWGEGYYNEYSQLQYAIKKLAIDYNDQLKHIKNYRQFTKQEKEEKNIVQTSEKCCVYLMHDAINNFYKIRYIKQSIF